LLDAATESKIMPERQGSRVLSDFTGDSYRLILEQSFTTLNEFEQTLSGVMNVEDWQKWYKKFQKHVRSSHREILKQVI